MQTKKNYKQVTAEGNQNKIKLRYDQVHWWGLQLDWPQVNS